MKAAAKDAPFSLQAEIAANRDEKDPGMRVSQAMTRDAYIAGQQVGWHPGQVCQSSIVPSACRHFVDRKLVDWKRRDARQSWGFGEASSRLSRPYEENTQIGWRAKQEQDMKLNSTQLDRTLSQFHAEVLPDNHPAVRQLNDLFGDHTFFLDASGLNVLEPAEMPEKEVQAGEIVNLASWSDENLTSLKPHAPAPTGVVVVLESRQWPWIQTVTLSNPIAAVPAHLERVVTAVSSMERSMAFGSRMFWCSVWTCWELIDFKVSPTWIMMTAKRRWCPSS
jgi:hypothetical protein